MSSVALAQVPDPQVVSIETKVACGTVTVTLVNKDTGEYGFRWNTVPGNGGSVGVKTGVISVASNKTATQTIRLEEDSYDGVAAFTMHAIYGPNGFKQKTVELYPIDTDCEPPAEPTTVPPPPPTTTPVPPPTTNPVPPTSTSVNPPPPVVVNPPPNTVIVVPPAVNNSNDVPVGGVATGDGSSL
jgi:hypothetical protein